MSVYLQEQITNEKSLEKVLQQVRESDHVFALDLSHLEMVSSKSIQHIAETQHFVHDRLYFLLPEQSQLVQIFRQESLLNFLNIFHTSQDLDTVIERQSTPCQRGFFPGPLFKLGQDAQNELDRLVEVCSRTSRCSLSSGIRQEFQQRGFALPSMINITKSGEDWLFYDVPQQGRLGDTKILLYMIRPEVYGQALEVCQQMVTLSPLGSLHGKEPAKEFFYRLRDENASIIFVNLNRCYAWDNEYASAYRKAKEFKKIYLIRADQTAVDFLFKTSGDIFYSDYEKAYTYAALILKKQWRISPNPDADVFTPQPIVELSGYISEEEDTKVVLEKLMKPIRNAFREFHRVCLDIRELYRMESKCRKALVSYLGDWCRRHKIRRSNIVVMATLPRPDYTIQDIAADFYEKGFFIIPNQETARELLESYPHPKFISENSTTASTLKVEGNITQDQEFTNFQTEVSNLVHNALSLTSDVKNVLRSPQQTVFFDFSSIPCVNVLVIQTILKTDADNKNLTKILLVNDHLAELIQKLLSKEGANASNVFCYHDINVATSQHIRNVLVVGNKDSDDDTKEYFQQIFQDIYHARQAQNTQFRIRFHFDFGRLSARLSQDSYDLLIFYGFTRPDDRQRVTQFLARYNYPVLEIIHEPNWLVLQPHQLESQAPKAWVKEKILGLLWKLPGRYQEIRLLFLGQHQDRILREWQDLLPEREWDVWKSFLPVIEDERYEIILTQKDNSTSKSVNWPMPGMQKFLEKIEFHIYQKWIRNFSYHYTNQMITLAQKVSDENAVLTTLDLAKSYVGLSQNLLQLIPSFLRKAKEEHWMELQLAKNNLANIMFRSLFFELEYALLIIQSEIYDLFQGQIWLGLQPLWDAMRQDLRYRGVEIPVAGIIQVVLNWQNQQIMSPAPSWLILSLECKEAETFEIIITCRDLVEFNKIPPTLGTAIETCQNRYQLEVFPKIIADGKGLEVHIILKSRLSPRRTLIAKKPGEVM